MFQYIVFNKPYGVLSQFTSEQGVRNLSEFNLPKDVYPVGRLDKDSEGLLLLSNDGLFIDQILHPKAKKEKSYLVQIENIPSTQKIKQLQDGVIIKGVKTLPCKVSLLEGFDLPPRVPPIRERKSIPTCWLKIQLQEGKNRQIRRMTASIDHPTLRIIRIGIGSYKMDNLAPGEWKVAKKSNFI